MGIMSPGFHMVQSLEERVGVLETTVSELLRILSEDGTIEVDGPDEAGLLNDKEE